MTPEEAMKWVSERDNTIETLGDGYVRIRVTVDGIEHKAKCAVGQPSASGELHTIESAFVECVERLSKDIK